VLKFDFQNLIWAIIGALIVVVVKAISRLIRMAITYCCLGLKTQRKNGDCVTVRVRNGWCYSLDSAYAYITIDHEESDILEPPSGFHAYVRPQYSLKVYEDRLCWSMAGNPARVDIYPFERQALDVAGFDPKREWIEFPSEDGWGSSGKPGMKSRVFLKWKKYSATIKIVSKDSWAKEFKVWINPDDDKTPLSRR
jgi:hypothetical protein